MKLLPVQTPAAAVVHIQLVHQGHTGEFRAPRWRRLKDPFFQKLHTGLQSISMQDMPDPFRFLSFSMP